MDQESLEKLIADKPKQIRAKAILLFNGAAKSAQEYQSSSTAANLRDWEAAQSALERYAAQIDGADGEPTDKPLADLADVLDYLKESDWKVSKANLYRHHKQGKISPRPDGSYSIKNVEKYARSWLKQQSTGKKIDEMKDDIWVQKLQEELKNLRLDGNRKALAYDREIGALIPREQVENELATRAGILDAGLKHWIQSRAAEWIRMADGDTKKVGDLINRMNHDLDEHINTYAAPLDYQVIIEAEEEAEGKPETEGKNET
jgi:hypothetical protein